MNDDAELRQNDRRQHAEDGEDGGQQNAGAGDDATHRRKSPIPSRAPCRRSSSRARVTRKIFVVDTQRDQKTKASSGTPLVQSARSRRPG